MARPLASSSRSSSASSLAAIETPDFLSRHTSQISSSATSILDEPISYTVDLAPKLSSALSTCLSSTLDEMIRTEGGGSWPPRPTYRDSWPHCLHIYDRVARQAPPRFVTPQLRPNYTDSELRQRIDENRLWLEQSLSSADVQQVMATLPELDVNARLGFLACTAYLIHLYRWGTLPVVAMAQDEKSIAFPDSIQTPFRWLNDFYGIESSGGCLYSMTLVNVVSHGGDDLELVYSNMRHMPYPSVVDAERYNAFVFYQMERLSLDLYHSIAQCQTLMAQGQEQQAADALKQGHVALRAAFRHFFDTLKEEKIRKSVWMSHAQGFHGWGVDDFDGVSGDHSLLIRTLDAFLDIPLRTEPGCPFATAQVPVKSWDALCPVSGASASTLAAPVLVPTAAPGLVGRFYNWMWPTSPKAETKLATVPCVGKKQMKEIRFSEVPYSNEYLPRGQVKWIRAVREARLRTLASTTPNSPVALEMNEMLKTFKLWRMGHTRKAVYYEDLELPERKPMTASGGVGGGVAQEDEGLAQMMEKLEARLRARIAATK
ncbi:hypothetical protein PSEUBRA_005087 [Kalmanozyma brasiliensis GHG001]|uniref:Indoleamine 2,3-dioxygenase n=1 Tax=Kalmanozyma brasiliensis (strain GHG001) TaxID=1365824 RepID=V5ETP3_KALBG|nr:uncharacterized protein PSEUBRA_005087 [Kalmanozyma brasiliensis GHG001]EST05414.1 hypothetical protein PSEUBRA_005087 [Kalmanozyma brasiliensis GHG001]